MPPGGPEYASGRQRDGSGSPATPADVHVDFAIPEPACPARTDACRRGEPESPGCLKLGGPGLLCVCPSRRRGAGTGGAVSEAEGVPPVGGLRPAPVRRRERPAARAALTLNRNS